MISKDVKETSVIAKKFLAKMLKTSSTKDKALVVCLSGNLGTGKTAFTKAIAQHLNIKNKISSPTFVIIKKYPLKNKKHRFFFHLDAYRLKNEKELLRLGWEDIIGNKEHLVFIEWPENVFGVIPPNAKFVYITHTKNGHRNFRFKV